MRLIARLSNTWTNRHTAGLSPRYRVLYKKKGTSDLNQDLFS